MRRLKIIGDAEAIRWVTFTKYLTCLTHGEFRPIVLACTYRIQAYFAGKQPEIKLGLDSVYIHFKKNVCTHLQQIPSKKTFAYSEVTKKMGDVEKMRGTDLANVKNPLAILIPFHPVIGSKGSLSGFAWGIVKKERLLNHAHYIPGANRLNLFK